MKEMKLYHNYKKKSIFINLTLIFLGTMFYLFANFQRIAIPGAVFDIMEQELHVTAPFITAFGAIFMYVYAFTQLINGVLVDRFGGFRIMLTGGIVLAVGALPKGQASFSTLTSKNTSAFCAKVEVSTPVIAIKGTLNLFIKGNKFNNSEVSPLLEIAITQS